MSDIRSGRGHMSGVAATASQEVDARREAHDGEAASRSGRRASTDVSLPPPDGKAISHRVVEAVPATSRPAAAESTAGLPKMVGGGEYIKGIKSVGMELRRAACLPDGRLAEVMEEHLSAETTSWKPTVTQLAVNAGHPDVTQRSMREAFYGTARGQESQGLSTPEQLRSNFAFVMKELLVFRAPQRAVLCAVAGWQKGLMSRRPGSNPKAAVALSRSLQQGLADAIQDEWTSERCPPAVQHAVRQLLMAPHQAVIEDMAELLKSRKAGPAIEPKLVARLVAESKSSSGAEAPVKWVAALLKSVAAMSDEIDQAAPARGPENTALVLQAVFKAMPEAVQNRRDAYVTPLVSALAYGLPPDRVVRAWMHAHVETLSLADRVDLVMSVLVQHEKLNLTGPALARACEALAQGFAHPVRDGKAAGLAAAHAEASSTIAKWFINVKQPDSAFRVVFGLARGFGFTADNGGSQSLAALLKGPLAASPPDVKRAVETLRSWQSALCGKPPWEDPAKAAALDLQVRAYFQPAIDEVLPVFSPDVAPTRKALLHALYGPSARKG